MAVSAAIEGISSLETIADSDPACVTGVPADDGSNSGWPIDYAAVNTSTQTRSYDVDLSWASQHEVMTSYLSMRHGGTMDEYACFKCQYQCNGASGCVSFFGRYVDVNMTTEHFECMGFDALLDPSTAFDYQPTKNIPVGGYNKLCETS